MRGGYHRRALARPGFSGPPRPSRYQGDSGDRYDGQGQSDGKDNASSVHRSPFQPVGCSNGQQDAREECTAQQPTPVSATIGAWQLLAIMGQVALIPKDAMLACAWPASWYHFLVACTKATARDLECTKPARFREFHGDMAPSVRHRIGHRPASQGTAPWDWCPVPWVSRESQGGGDGKGCPSASAVSLSRRKSHGAPRVVHRPTNP